MTEACVKSEIDQARDDSVKTVVDALNGLWDKAYRTGCIDGAAWERKRVREALSGDPVSIAQPSVQAPAGQAPVAEAEKPAKVRKNPWANYTPEQRAERLKVLAGAREKAFALRAAKSGDGGTLVVETASGTPETVSPGPIPPEVPAAADMPPVGNFSE